MEAIFVRGVGQAQRFFGTEREAGQLGRCRRAIGPVKPSECFELHDRLRRPAAGVFILRQSSELVDQRVGQAQAAVGGLPSAAAGKFGAMGPITGSIVIVPSEFSRQ